MGLGVYFSEEVPRFLLKQHDNMHRRHSHFSHWIYATGTTLQWIDA